MYRCFCQVLIRSFVIWRECGCFVYFTHFSCLVWKMFAYLSVKKSIYTYISIPSFDHNKKTNTHFMIRTSGRSRSFYEKWRYIFRHRSAVCRFAHDFIKTDRQIDKKNSEVSLIEHPQIRFFDINCCRYSKS